MVELVVLLVAFVALGVLRPRWSTLAAALVPTGMAFAWLVLHEDIPGETLGPVDLAWYAGMSLVVGAAFALACAAGVIARSFLDRGRRATPRQDAFR